MITENYTLIIAFIYGIIILLLTDYSLIRSEREIF
jgi:hypothetical protein